MFASMAVQEHLIELQDRAAVIDPFVQRVTGHSLRRGLVTELHELGYSAIQIAQQTRHKDVGQVARYTEKLDLEKADWGTALFGNASVAV